MSTIGKSGPVTTAELRTLWESSTDSGYNQTLIRYGDGSGLEAWGQLFEQLRRFSETIDISTQAMYITPWSGQSNPPAGGGRKARVTLTFSRTRRLQHSLIFDSSTLVEEETEDSSQFGAITVHTGRRYRLLNRLVFAPGETGPFEVEAEAVGEGYGYNAPEPGSLRFIVQVGKAYYNDLASVRTSGVVGTIIAANKPDSFVPEQIGQYVELIGGLNSDKWFRIVSYQQPNPAAVPPHGGIVSLESTYVFQGANVGSFLVGENVEQASTGAIGLLVADTTLASYASIVVIALSGSFNATDVLTGASSAAVHTPAMIIESPVLVDETQASTWRMLDFVDDLGVTVTNAESPHDGRLAVLDALGDERDIKRGANEDDDSYRERVATPADTVSPNAIIRGINQVLSRYSLDGCFREVGTVMFPGFYYDVDAYDYDFELNPFDRFKLLVDYVEMRAFFLIGVPLLNWGEFGFSFDVGIANAWDFGFFDGHPSQLSAIYTSLWNVAEERHAGGVGFDLYQEKLGCF